MLAHEAGTESREAFCGRVNSMAFRDLERNANSGLGRIMAPAAGLALAAALAVAVSAPARASTLTFDLASDFCGGGCGSGPFGKVTVSSIATNEVSVDVTLFSGDKFVKTGAGDSLVFDIMGNPAISITNLTGGFTVGTTMPGGSIHAAATGYWEYDIRCSACGSGASNPQTGPLDFDVTVDRLVPADFTRNGAGFYFAVDILGAGNTSLVASNDPVMTVPEPFTPAALAAGLIVMGAAFRPRIKAARTARA